MRTHKYPSDATDAQWRLIDAGCRTGDRVGLLCRDHRFFDARAFAHALVSGNAR